MDSQMKTDRDLVSIVVPVYNVENYVARCINSIIAQSYDCIECLIIDDCGTDSSMAICEKIISVYHGNIRFKILCHDENKGLSEARNTGIRNSQGKWIYFLDSDDWIEPYTIADMVILTESYPTTTMVMGKIDCPQESAYHHFPFVECTDHVEGRAVGEYLFLTDQISVTAWNKLILKDIITRNNAFFEPRFIYEDELWMYKNIKHFNSLSFTGKVTYHYDYAPNSIMAKNSLKRKQYYWDQILTFVLDHPSAHFGDTANLKYLKILMSYYRLISPEKSTSQVYDRFIKALSHKYPFLVKGLRIYNFPYPKPLRRALRKLLNAYINTLFCRQ